MSEVQSLTRIVGTEISEELESTVGNDAVVGLAGDDTISASKGDDVVFGDYIGGNLLEATEGATSFAQFGESGAWKVTEEAGGHTSMTQAVNTIAGETYSLSFDIAANYGSGTLSGAVEVLWNGVVIDSFDTNSASFSAHEVSFKGVSGVGELTFRSIDSKESTGPVINTDGPIFHYDSEVIIGGEEVTVKAFAEGQTNIYQVLNGTLNVYDPVSETYSLAGEKATVVANAIGFNVEDDLIYGIAVGNGVDSRGNKVEQSDLVMYDATGASFLVGSTPYRSWTGDFDSNGNLWAFHSSFDRVTKIDVDKVGKDGEVASVTYKMPKKMVTDNLWDVAFNAETQCFSGVTRPTAEGKPGYLYQFDISDVANGGEPTFTKTAITSTLVDGETFEGMPYITFGAAIYDADGNLYVGGNGGDHDLNDDTATSGGIYRVETNPDTGETQLVLMAASPKSYSNDGTADPRAIDPFTEVDKFASVLIRQPSLTQQPDPETTFDDVVDAGAGQDEVHGGFGNDVIEGQSGGDLLTGGIGDDQLYGGKSDGIAQPRTDYYDEDGIRYNAKGEIIASDDDKLFGGEGSDYLHGSSGNDYLNGGAGDDKLNGGSGLDALFGGIGNDYLAAGAENDQLHGGEGDDLLIGGSGDDQMFGDAGNDDLRGGDGFDFIDGGDGNDQLNGGVGDDQLVGGAGDDVLKGSTGNDTLSDSSGTNALFGGSGDDKLTGGTGEDLLNGGSGNDALYGGDGTDVLKGGNGDDKLHGGDDRDKLYGGKGNDRIEGGKGSDYINASSGDDVIIGGDGKDKIFLGGGSDIVMGGTGSDKFVFRTEDLDGSTDTILDFTRGPGEVDKLDLRLLNLSLDGMTEEDWIAENVVQNIDDSVTVSLNGLTINLADHNGLEEDFFAQVSEGIML
ncbi:MAG: calcium-binding protein [Pikeienuella sp.]